MSERKIGNSGTCTILNKDLTMKYQVVTRIVRLRSDTPNYRIDAFSFKDYLISVIVK
jgi:hypothetical protein